MKKQFVDEISILLAQNHLISPQEVMALHTSFKSQSNLNFEEFLLEEGIVEKNDLLKVLSQYYQMPSIDVNGLFFDHHDVRLIPKAVMLQHYFIPYTREGDNLTIIAANPNDPHLPVIIGKYVSHDLTFFVGLANDIIDAVEENYDQSITYQPNDIQNQQMERSQIDVHPGNEVLKPEDSELEIPAAWQDNIDDYERD